ncbi:hypothetical protein SAMN03159463_04561 [Mesorhizobium sp. NFR06]|uniref:hypothetical protein n=1 Tax=Mesorhizobium sp. NFR06 TaxID=1566290 RepID=UPI0008F368F8|nr:hypothetical protein [Mesorhizobium sp. NFR06]SFP63307.1 hypothetical protein SAMN03159463_04561 [Mesorhizobium sp. NFR06]
MFNSYTELRKNALAILLVGAVFVLGGYVFVRNLTNDVSPIQAVDMINATIKSVQWGGRNSPTTYVLFLDGGATVLVNDDRPHLIGSRASVERVTRDTGFVSYRFAQ